MAIIYREVKTDILSQYAAIPAQYSVRNKFSLSSVNHGLGGILFSLDTVTPAEERTPEMIYGAMAQWEQKWAIAHWGVMVAEERGVLIGGVVVAYDTPRMPQLEERRDMAQLMDIRVHPQYRREGMAEKLFQMGEAWAYNRGCKFLKAETQNTNVVACRFLVKQSCQLTSLNRFAYRHLPEDVQLIWLKYIG